MLYAGCVKAVLRLHEGSITDVLRLYEPRSAASFFCLHTSAYVSIQPAYVSICQHTACIRQQGCINLVRPQASFGAWTYVPQPRREQLLSTCIRQHTSAYATTYVSIRQHTACIRQHTSADTCRSRCCRSSTTYRSVLGTRARPSRSAYISIRQHTSAYVSRYLQKSLLSDQYCRPSLGTRARRSRSAYVSIRQHTSADTCRSRSCRTSTVALP
jgi:hypothetical protein